MALYLLYESSSGYALFETKETEVIGMASAANQKSLLDISSFKRMVSLVGFQSFTSAENAFQEINHVADGLVSDFLKDFLTRNLPKKTSKVILGCQDHKLATTIHDTLNLNIKTDDTVLEIFRGVRLHFPKLVQQFKEGDIVKAQLGLGHSFSRAKVKFNVNKADNMIIQAICLLDQLDKDLNTFSMRIKEWYSWHFPELVKVVSDNFLFARLALCIKDKGTLDESKLPDLAEITEDQDKAKLILDAARASMGTDLSPVDMINIENFARQVIDLHTYRKSLHAYLQSKMSVVAPNLSVLIGETVGARLISHAGSLMSLAKYPASTVQILGAEKALFRALKTRGKTPKYGLIFNSTFIGRAAQKNKGRISRYLANKCSIASRIDSFSDEAGSTFGAKLRDQVEERLKFYDSGEAPRKNIDVMKEAIAEMAKESKSKKRKSKGGEEAQPPAKKAKVVAEAEPEKKKKKKKAKEPEPEPEPVKKKKKKSSKEEEPIRKKKRSA
eukprot:gnl/Hemi2/19492_TR6479_c0_g2_i1.p1 gnl/Hemi2/19492_TR6479_c0_g2~~gnl/Hemi2/19492_TR6479_c0_g2_i1.p1  ORF type:complete len:500 (+),score=212.42 gnl/Hemi2/19492_TR6479_c0_g2_i1:81-1580(+)